ncbi:hypothetical protein Tco_1559856 [Tanacetum coccineum]
MPRGTTRVVPRGASNDWCQTVQVAGTRWRLDQSEGDTWHWRVSVRGTVAGGGWTNKKVTRGTGVCQYEVL